MRIFVKAKPSARKEAVEKVDDLHFVVSVKEPPDKGKANQAVIKALADYFNVPAVAVKIVSGHTGRQKIVEIG